MDSRDKKVPCHFDKLLTKNVPLILEKIFYSLDYDSFKNCMEVSNTWKELLSSESYQKIQVMLFEVMLLEKHNGNKLWWASWRGDTEEVRNLLSTGQVDLKCLVGEHGWTALHGAAINGNKDVVQLLLDIGTDPNKANNTGWTALPGAACKGHKDVVQLLLDEGADPNTANTSGWTALHQAAWYGH